MRAEIRDNYPMRFGFEGNLYRANMTANTLCKYKIPIKLPDGRFVWVNGWLESYPLKPAEIEIVENYSGDKYAIAKSIDDY